MRYEQAPAGLSDLTDYYSILDLKPDASPAAIREAYFKTKSTYQKDNVALYTLIDPNDREDMLARIEEAYQVLSSPDRRREYDQFYEQISSSPFNSTPSSLPSNSPSALPSSMAQPAVPTGPKAKVISIDRSAPMEPVDFSKTGDPLNPPCTDFAVNDANEPPPSITPHMPALNRPAAVSLPQEFENEIREQADWSGSFLRRVREARRISLEEVTLATKITKAYILAIEEENFPKLPAAVFIRGFVSQIARLLKLPHQQVAASYMARLQRANPEKFR